MKYKEPWGDEQSCYNTGHSANVYKDELFNDEFERGKVNSFKGIFEVKLRADRSGVIAGGINNAFAPGKTVLELGSGRACALLQFSKDYPKTVFIGIDERYDQKGVTDIKQSGVHLINDKWSTLRTIPDQSVDTILSFKGAFTHGVHESNPQASLEIVNTLNRVAKPGAILRYDTDRGWSGNYEKGDEWRVNFLRDNGWEVHFTKGNTNIAIKKN